MRDLRALAWGRLLRLSNAPTIPADLIAGFCTARFLGGAEPWNTVSALATLAACWGIYHGALVLNDRLDLAHDARTRPDRPLPSGAISIRQAHIALFACAAMAGAGLLLAPAHVAIGLVCLAMLATSYDLLWKRNAITGPLALGGCRALDLGLGMMLAGWPPHSLPAVVVLAAYALYVIALSGLARMEDGTPRLGAIRVALACAGCFFAAGPLSLGWSLAAPVAIALGLFVVSRAWVGAATWPRERVGRTVGRLLSLLALFGALLCWAADAPLAAAIVGGLYVMARLLARVIPPS